tara:strand:- start:19112 stop:19690 length:579 start_codon:yes stop_codon:yes gene_type:complete
MSTDEKKHYTYDYWFKNDFHKSWHEGGEEYYVNRFYEDIVFNLDIPNEGYIVVLGTYKCVSFEKLCKKYGAERCIGYDLHNPTNHPRVIIKNGLELSSEDNIPIAFCHNDFGGFQHTPKLKIHGQKWAAQNIIPGGYFLGNSSQNSINFDIEKLMSDIGFVNTRLVDLPPEKFNLSNLPEFRHHSYMLSRRK